MSEIGRCSGRRVPEKSNFSQTCNLLSQYLKEKRSFGDLSFGTTSTLDSGKSAAMDLFPQHTGFGPNTISTEEVATELSEKKGKKQMTIIYGGKVVVFDEIPAEKVKELINIVGATNGNSGASSSTSGVVAVEERPITIQQPHVSALPIARKASLHRFLEKRKDRINARAPYQVNNSTKPEESKMCLGLTFQSSMELRL